MRLLKRKATSLAQSLEGKVSGLKIRQNDGEPGQFRSDINIRGLGTPLFIIDGIVRDGANEFQRLNPDDIKHFFPERWYCSYLWYEFG